MTFHQRVRPAHLPRSLPSTAGAGTISGQTPGQVSSLDVARLERSGGRGLVAQVLASPAVRQAERLLMAGAGRGIAKRPVRVPETALVPIRTMRLAAPAARLALAAPPAGTANDNAPTPAAPRPLWREILFLGILVVTLYGAYLAGRADGLQKVIEVPAPMSPRSVIT